MNSPNPVGGCILACALALLLCSCERSSTSIPQTENVRSFPAKGTIQKIEAEGRTVVIRHEAISNYMDAMTMPFHVKQTNELAGMKANDEVAFRLFVTENESWIAQIVKIGESRAESPRAPTNQAVPDGSSQHQAAAQPTSHPLWNYKFTNELGQAVSLADFRGQALAITFFFTRCPIPEYCPRLSRNFEEASKKLTAMPESPTNWHLLSVSFDTAFDTPAVLKNYADGYHYNPRNWSFLTGPREKIEELARQSGATFEADGSLFNHNFRTLIVDGAGRLQMTFPIGGDLSDAIVNELVKAAKQPLQN